MTASSPSVGPAQGRGVAAGWHWVGIGLAAVALVAAALAFMVFDPARTPFFPRCAFHELSGLHCPGCGGQRAVHALLHGEMTQAFRCNALLLVLIPVGAWVLARWTWKTAARRELPALFQHHYWAWLLVAVIVVFGVLRNLPGFAWLAP